MKVLVLTQMEEFKFRLLFSILISPFSIFNSQFSILNSPLSFPCNKKATPFGVAHLEYPSWRLEYSLAFGFCGGGVYISTQLGIISDIQYQV